MRRLGCARPRTRAWPAPCACCMYMCWCTCACACAHMCACAPGVSALVACVHTRECVSTHTHVGWHAVCGVGPVPQACGFACRLVGRAAARVHCFGMRLRIPARWPRDRARAPALVAGCTCLRARACVRAHVRVHASRCVCVACMPGMRCDARARASVHAQVSVCLRARAFACARSTLARRLGGACPRWRAWRDLRAFACARSTLVRRLGCACPRWRAWRDLRTRHVRVCSCTYPCACVHVCMRRHGRARAWLLLIRAHGHDCPRIRARVSWCMCICTSARLARWSAGVMPCRACPRACAWSAVALRLDRLASLWAGSAVVLTRSLCRLLAACW